MLLLMPWPGPDRPKRIVSTQMKNFFLRSGSLRRCFLPFCIYKKEGIFSGDDVSVEERRGFLSAWSKCLFTSRHAVWNIWGRGLLARRWRRQRQRWVRLQGAGERHTTLRRNSFLNDIQVCVCYSSFYYMDIRTRTLRSDQTYRRLAPHDDDDYVVVTPPATSQQQPFWCTWNNIFFCLWRNRWNVPEWAAGITS